MKLTHLKENGRDPAVVEYRDGTKVLYSYEQPVAAFVPGLGYMVLKAEYSATTARRIEAWVGDNRAMSVNGAQLGSLIVDRIIARPDQGQPNASAEETLDMFQQQAGAWAVNTFGEDAASNIPLRCHRFTEESLELVQSLGITKDEVLKLVDYVFSRPEGEPAQEVGGTMTTLAVLCRAAELSMARDGYRELNRVSDPEVAAKIRQKHLNKPKFGPLPA